MINVTEAKYTKMLNYIGLEESDLRFLQEQKEAFAAITDAVVDKLYDNIYAQPELAQIIDKHSTLDRLKETQRWYFMSMVDGVIDMEFIERRIGIGKIHSRIGLTTDWYLGTYMQYLDIATQCFKKTIPDKWTEIVLKLSKMFNFDSQLVLEAYLQEEHLEIQKMSDAREQTLIKVNQAVQDLISMITELGSSSQSVSESATHTAEIQEEANSKVQLLRDKVNEIQEVGSLLQDISDQTHLLGLNAAIEAAHAGEFGAGFGVVANEIRKLASNSKESLEHIKTSLDEMISMINDVTKNSENTTALAREQASRSQELSSFVGMLETVTAELESINKD